MELEFPIHHVIVVGFHHKKGCQIEFAFPPFEVDIEKTAWKYLPTLAMPDGAHNYTTDTVYFHLPSLKKAGETVFGVACYQQIDADKVKNKSDEVTRSTVQKSVCVLSKYPLYGHMQVKMSLITAAYFREGDFAQISILEEAYHNLNVCLSPDLLETPETFCGLSPRELVFTFRHEVLVLLKLLLLEKRILFRGASVGPLCSALLTLISLIPLTLEYGLQESACVKTSEKLSIVPQFSNGSLPETPEEEIGSEKMDVDKPSPTGELFSKQNRTFTGKEMDCSEPSVKMAKDLINTSLFIQGSVASRHGGGGTHRGDTTDDVGKRSKKDELPLERLGSSFSDADTESVCSEKVSEDIPDFVTAVNMTAADAGLPLKLFTKGYLCHPYLSLHYMDLLSDTRVRGFIVGATNMLFKQKRGLVDVIVEMQDSTVEISDPALKKMVTLTTEDLRFVENLVKNVNQDSSTKSSGGDVSDNFLDGVGWEGGDEWIRAQFKYYLMCLMRTSLVEDSNKIRDCFGSSFVSGWQTTHHWKIWNSYVNSEERDTPGIYLLSPGHPYFGQISMSDMKLRFTHSMQRAESARKINNAVGKAVASTGKAVGGALSQAKGALSSWWSAVSSTSTTGVEIGSEDTIENTDTSNSGQSQNSPVTSNNRDTTKTQSVWFTP